MHQAQLGNSIMNDLVRNSRGVGKVTLTFTSLLVALLIALIILSSITSSQISALQTTNSQLQNNGTSLQSQYNQLESEYQQLQSEVSSQTPQTATPQIEDLQNQIQNLQSQLQTANTIIAQLQGPTGILPVYSDLGYVQVGFSSGYYALQLSLKNTGTTPITQIYVTIASIQIAMNFTYLNATVSENSPLPAYQTASGRQNVSPPVMGSGTYSLIIQGLASNGTTYTYQTNMTSHA